MCGMHYSRVRKYGDPNEVRCLQGRSVEERFWVKVQKTDTCWLWTGAKNDQGYGQIKGNRKLIYAHRYSLYLKTGIFPKLFVLHLCDVPHCVNPDHLREGSQQENMTDAVNKGRHAIGSRNGHAKLSESLVVAVWNRLEGGEKQASIARSLNISSSAISHMVNGNTWRHVKKAL